MIAGIPFPTKTVTPDDMITAIRYLGLAIFVRGKATLETELPHKEYRWLIDMVFEGKMCGAVAFNLPKDSFDIYVKLLQKLREKLLPEEQVLLDTTAARVHELWFAPGCPKALPAWGFPLPR